jgi:anti-sigma regulatory factor (Ser/Thr protein kinase)/Na+-translocating ferredoxin:NAD+ oxidoreductase RNF subunit RnfB
MNSDSYSIVGGDFDRAGYASSRLKEQLKKIGVEPALIRRAVIAAYEAETNVVIHARKGNMRVELDTGQIDVEVTDEGPGIPDIELAMKEGFSTAPPAARELGFGAGMGLPNIQMNTDRFEIQSTVGFGTRVAFTVYLRPHEAAGSARNSIRVVFEACRECLSCLRACPTGALRVREGRPIILEHLCIDCPECIEACETGALTVAAPAEMPVPSRETVLVVPPAFLMQFGAGVSPEKVLSVLATMGFVNVRVMDEWERALRDAAIGFSREPGRVHPVVSPACPAVVNLIEMRFPSLIPHIAPFLAPTEAAHHELRGCDAVFVAACPAQYTVLTSKQFATNSRVVTPSRLRQELLLAVSKRGASAGELAPPRGPSREDDQRVLRVNGIRHVMSTLEQVEDGVLDDVPVMELFACDQGCFGSPLWTDDAFVTRHRWLRSGGGIATAGNAVRQNTLFRARAGMRLDSDMTKAIVKLSQIDQLTKRLPGKNCGMCGAPTCSAFAEDVVMNRVSITACRHSSGIKGEPHDTE